ncbi:MAG: hypothetical protein IJO45_05165 [Oscillospiraceae bacterium]|nr:hypothetical protein [Oscillospiraceae bacterium]
MRGSKLFMAVDLGTSFIKTGVYDLGGNCLAMASEPVPDERPGPGIFLQHGPELYGSVLRCIRKSAVQLGERAEDVCAVAFTGQMAGAMGVDENWEDVTTWSCSLDSRYLPYANRQRELFADDLFSICGTNAPVMCAKYDWFKNEFPQEHKRIAKYVMLNGYVIGKLSGIPVADACMDNSLITWTGMADIRSRSWSQELCEKMGVDKALLPRIVNGTDVGGYLSDEMAKQLGLKSGIPLVAGAGDKVSGCIGSAVFDDGDMIFEASSYGAVSAMVEDVKLDEKKRNYDVIGAMDSSGYYAHKYIQGSGIAIDWFVETFMDKDFQKAEELASKAPLGSGNMLNIGLLGGSAMPFDSEQKGLIMGHTWNHHKGHFYRSLLEGFSYDLALTLRSLESNYSSLKGQTIKLIGGGAKSAVWPQILADVTGHGFALLSRSDVALWGTALLAAAGTGAVADIKEAARANIQTGKVFTPDEAVHKAYVPYVDLYEEATVQMKDLYAKLNKL